MECPRRNRWYSEGRFGRHRDCYEQALRQSQAMKESSPSQYGVERRVELEGFASYRGEHLQARRTSSERREDRRGCSSRASKSQGEFGACDRQCEARGKPFLSDRDEVLDAIGFLKKIIVVDWIGIEGGLEGVEKGRRSWAEKNVGKKKRKKITKK